MSLTEILTHFSQDDRIENIRKELSGSGSELNLTGLSGSVGAFIGSALYRKVKSPMLLVFPDREEALYHLGDMETLTGESNTFFFPSSYRRQYNQEDTDNANVLQRTEVLHKISRLNKPFLIATYPEAIAELVVEKQQLTTHTFTLKRGEKPGMDFLAEFLREYKFEQEDYVTDPGQFSIRGGIVDIFSYSGELPLRIEFFGEEVESIREFDPVTQLSVKEMDTVSILPDVQEKVSVEKRVPLLSFLPEDSLIWIKDPGLLNEKLDKNLEDALALDQENDSVIRRLNAKGIFLSGSAFQEELKRFRVVFTGQVKKGSNTFEVNTSPQPPFNKNFELLIQNLRGNTVKGYRNFIFFDSVKQSERLEVIFNDLASQGKSQIIYTPVIASVHEGFVDHDQKLAVYTDHQIFERYHRFRIKQHGYEKDKAITLKELYTLQPGDYIVHIDHGVGKFAGLEKIDVNGKMQEAIRLIYKDNDILYVSIHSLHRISRFVGKEGTAPKVNKLGTQAWNNLKQKTKKKVKEIAFDLIKLYAKRKASKGFAYRPDTYLQQELEASFIYQDTPDQEKATRDVKRDMEAPYPMDRLVCGDVGFGKTEIAIRAAFKAATDGKQVAVLVPTTVLAHQHYRTFRERLKDFPVKVDFINRFRSAKEQKDTLKDLGEGKVDILIGTHKLAGKNVKFMDLGLLIIDEEQKFGVGVKEKLKTLKENVDSLTLTATPIPRTLQFSMMGARDLSVINTPPPNRYPVQTEIHVFNDEVIRDAVKYEIDRGGQVFFVHNRISDIKDIAGKIGRLVPDARVAVAHGQMEGDKLEMIMKDFIEGYFDVLVTTTIIESGLDISNANTILINQAQNFGLSDLHQMRGRVGRSNKKAFCYLLTPPHSTWTPEARKRLAAIEQFSDLGSGFLIAMRDLDIRGAGDLLGGEQSGFISEIGYEMYQKILDEAMQELKEEEFKGLYEEYEEQEKGKESWIPDCTIETDLELLIPDDYVSNITERLSLYKELDGLESDEELDQFRRNLMDRFGPVPEPTDELTETIKLRRIASRMGIEKLVLKSGKLVAWFINNSESSYYKSETFTEILRNLSKNPEVRMKETNGRLSLSITKVPSIGAAIKKLEIIHQGRP